MSSIRVGIPMLLMVTMAASGCGSSEPPANPAGSGDASFSALAREILDDVCRRNPTFATYLGIHKHDHELEDFSRAALEDELVALRAFGARLDAVNPATLSPIAQLDREQLRLSVAARLLDGEVIRPWATNPDVYSSGITNTAYIMIKRSFAPPRERLKLLVAREQAMPALLADARKNLDNPPRILTEIAIEQLDGNREFFQTAVVEAFAGVDDRGLRAEFKKANDAVIAALADYKRWLTADLLPRSKGNYAIGADTYRKKLWADEMIDTPLDALLALAEADLRRNQAAFADTARKIDPLKPARDVLRSLEDQHPAPSHLIPDTQHTLEALAIFIRDKRIVTIPEAEPARVQETPPFLRATTSASMDIPGPFERIATEAYYSMTLPEDEWSAAQKNEFMRQWYPAAISNVSVHEVYPGHYLQFLRAKDFPSDTRKVFDATSNVEGWAHYAEQLMLDEGFHSDDPRYRLAQLQDALLRDVRFIAGIKMHTAGMTLDQAKALFETEGYQSAPVALSEAKRGTSDPTYGYYTMGKLMILKLRDDYRAKMGPAFSLQAFHDTFIGLGPLPVPLIRKAMLGAIGAPF